MGLESNRHCGGKLSADEEDQHSFEQAFRQHLYVWEETEEKPH